jgi:membrane associated rhomboid family serine protease
LNDDLTPDRPRRVVDHAPLRRWSPLTRQERAEAREFVERLVSRPWLTWAVVAVLVWFFLVQLVLGWPFYALLPTGEPLDEQLAMEFLGQRMGMLTADGVARGEIWRLVSATLLHGSLLHLVGNVVVLYMLGRLVENAYGRAAWLVTYVGAGAAGAGLSVLVSGHDSLGASGAILGMLGAAVVFGVRYRGEIPKALRDFFGIDLWFFVLMVAVLSLFPFVDWAGHLGGFLWGVVVALVWPARMVTGPPTSLGRTLQSSAAGVAVAAMIATLGVVGVRIGSLDEDLPEKDLRALRSAIDDEDVAAQVAVGERLRARYGELLGVQVLTRQVFIVAGRWDLARDATESVESQWPEVADRAQYWDNDTAWLLFRGFPDDPEAVTDGLVRARRALKSAPEEHAVRNTLALGLLLDGQADRAEEVLSELMKGASRDEAKDDAFLRVLALIELDRAEEALTEYQAWVADYPDGEMQPEAEAALKARGLL